jgi:hypothetical protein
MGGAAGAAITTIAGLGWLSVCIHGKRRSSASRPRGIHLRTVAEIERAARQKMAA